LEREADSAVLRGDLEDLTASQDVHRRGDVIPFIDDDEALRPSPPRRFRPSRVSRRWPEPQ
jgi:hypothetical protein